jgi:steroid 5-alpha reductase family enzyme
MKSILKKIFINKFSEIILIIFVAGFSLDLLAFPLMSASSSIKNIIGGAILVFFVMFIVMYASEMLSDKKK